MANQRNQRSRDGDGDGDTVQRVLAGAATVAAAAGIAYLIGRTLKDDSEQGLISDSPPGAWRGKAKPDALVERTVTINRPREELFAFWRDFTNLPKFMDNIRSIERLDDKRSHWVVKAPAGTTVEFVSRVTEEEAGRLIAWESEEGAGVPNRGRIEFTDAPPGRGTYVRATLVYDPPAGALGRAVAKVLQREPNVQVRRDLRRFKQLMETGEVTSSAGPSDRKSEDPTKQSL